MKIGRRSNIRLEVVLSIYLKRLNTARLITYIK
jgi:hypothetical protein